MQSGSERTAWFARTAGAVILAVLVVLGLAPAGPAVRAQQLPAVGPLPPDAERLRPTVHAALPKNVDDYWFAPRASDRAAARNSNLVDMSAAFAAGNYALALSHARQAAVAVGPLEVYAQYYIGLSQLRLSNASQAEAAFAAVLARKPEGDLSVAAAIGSAEAAELRGDHAAAAEIYDKLLTRKSAAPEEILARLARAATAAGDRKRAADAWRRVYYEFPLSDAASAAADALASLQDVVVKKDIKLDFGRALTLFGAKRYPEARAAFQDLQPQVSGDDREVADLRIAECDYFLKRYPAARDGVRPYLEQASRRAEARFFYLSALRGLGDADQAVTLTSALVADFPDSTWAEEALNNLGTYYILANQDDLAAETFRTLFEKFPNGPHAERAAWKYGWRAYTTGKYAETARVFESAAAAFPHSDYRPPYLYWAARAREKLGQRESSEARMRLVYADYMNSYYGRLASHWLPDVQADDPDDVAATGAHKSIPASLASNGQAPPVAAAPPNADLIRRLLATGLYDDGLNELRYAQQAWGTSPAIEATIAWVYHEKGDLRRAITVMRRAYPQFLAAGGEGLPAEILQVIFPLTFWESIKRNAKAHALDPYIVAALIAQESTFDPAAHSSANAWGLMQIVPSTGRRLASALGIRRFSTPMLTNADTNIRLGTLYFSRLVQQFGGTYYALASYNAGESRVIRWKAERPGMEEDEFIDDIPFPETQNYVKRILGTAEDYRHLYAGGGVQMRPAAKAARKTAPAKKTTKKKKAPVRKRPSVKKKR